jgi:aspartate dehydrogenase
MAARTSSPLRVGLAGLGAVGLPVARKLEVGIDGLTLAAVAVRDTDRARRHLPRLGQGIRLGTPGDLATDCDVVVEGLPPNQFRAVAEPTLRAGRIFMPLSVGQLLEHGDLVALAKQTGGRILVPTGALLGLDAVRAAAEGTIHSVAIITRKPPAGLEGAPYLVANKIDLKGLTQPLRVFAGTAREGARGFPANVNVAAALSLAGVGPDLTRLEIWADPGIERNMHRIEVEADCARFTMEIAGVPSTENPRTGRITALSTIAALRGLVGPLRVGT